MKSKNSIKGQTNTAYTNFVILKFPKFHLFWLSMYNTRILLPISIRDASNIKQYTGGSEKTNTFSKQMPIVQLVLEIKFSFIQRLFYVISQTFAATDFAKIVEYIAILGANFY